MLPLQYNNLMEVTMCEDNLCPKCGHYGCDGNCS